jgi:hypothetical protein
MDRGTRPNQPELDPNSRLAHVRLDRQRLIPRICAFCFLVLGVSGCLSLPWPAKLSTGPRFSREALAFLDQNGTTRTDVLASLGKPIIEMSDPGELIYVSETTSRTVDIPYQVYGIGPDGPASVTDGPSKGQALFIAYDKHGSVFAHKIRAVDSAGLESACLKWRLGLTEP